MSAEAPTYPPNEGPPAAPSRFRSFILRIATFVGAILLVLGLRLWWGYAADRELRRMADAAHARHEPFLPEDFDPTPVPDVDNAALSFRHAADAVEVESLKAMDDATLETPMPEASVRALDGVVAANQKTLQLARQAQSRNSDDWQIRARRPVLSTYPPPDFLEGQRLVANVIGWAAVDAHAHRNDREAIDRLLELVHQSQILDRAAPGMVCNLVSMGITDMAANYVGLIAPDLAVGDTTPARQGAPATGKQVRQLITGLLDEKPFFAGVERAWYGERMMDVDAALHLGADFRDPLRQLWAIKPMFDLDGARIARQHSQAARAATAPNLPAARAAMPSAETGDSSQFWQASRALSTILLPASGRAMQQEFRALTERRAAATILAIRLYRLDHAGKYPTSLAQLVPAYLPSVPADPMAAGGKALRYKPDAAPPVIYSVGEDGIDGGGTSLPDDTPRGFRWNQPDAVYPLARPLRTTQPSTETQNDQADVGDGQRNQTTNAK
jgi:hypothetical protein